MTYTLTFILLLAALAGVMSWGVTQVLKNGLLSYRRSKKIKGSPWWWNTLLRVVAIAVGSAVGWFLAPDQWGIVIGAAGGVLNTTLVAFVKAKLMANAEDGELTGDLTVEKDEDDDSDIDDEELSR